MAIELVVQLTSRSRRYVLAPGESIIGSSSVSTIRIPHPTVSRRHARVQVRGERVELEDLGSSNGTRIGTRRLVGPTEILPGTVVAFGGVSAVLERVAEDDREPALLLTHTGELDSTGSMIEIADSATASVEPFDHFLRNGLPALVSAVRAGASDRAVAEQLGMSLSRSLPCLALEIAEGTELRRATSLFSLPDTRRPGSADSGHLATSVGDLHLTYELPTTALAALFQPLAELGLALVALARQRSLTPMRPPVRSTFEPPPLPAPASVVPEVRAIYRDAARVAQGEVSVLIRGESGTGKEVLAQYLHQASRRASGPFLALNCAALPQSLLETELFGIERGVATGVEERSGLFERASGGTLFLDEVGDMALETQAKLLRALEVGELYRVGGRRPYSVDVRVLSATNRDLEGLMRTDQFREDLYFRIADWEVVLPPLRERRADIPQLAGHFLAEESRRARRRIRGISRAAMAALESFDWPGNIRHLQKEMARVALLIGPGELLDSARLDPAIVHAAQQPGGLKGILQRAEREYLVEILERYGSDRQQVARHLGVSEITLYRRMKAYELS